jgi:hypothetical protein
MNARDRGRYFIARRPYPLDGRCLVHAESLRRRPCPSSREALPEARVASAKCRVAGCGSSLSLFSQRREGYCPIHGQEPDFALDESAPVAGVGDGSAE